MPFPAGQFQKWEGGGGLALVAKVAVENAAYHFDKLYDYRVPPGMALAPGQRVMVPFGRGKAPKRLGLVLETEEVPEGELPAGIKEIASAADLEPVLDGEMLQLLRWLRGETFCTWFDGVKVLLPGGYGMKSQTAFSLCRGAEGEALTSEEGQILDYLRPRKNPAPEEELLEALGLVRGHPALRSLEERGLILRQDLLKRRVKDQKLQMVRLAPDWERAFLTPKQQAVLELLQQAGCASVKEICYFAGVTKGVVDNFVKAGGGVYYLEETYRDPYQEAERAGGREAIALSPQQQGAAEQLEAVYRRRDGSTALLFGVTGSGKTQVFMKLIDRALEDGRQAIVLVPEISLTPQTIKKFHSHYGSWVAVLHSGLSMSQRLDEWKRARRGLVDVVVGTRSAVFAPLPRLGLMVIDEEQEHTYQSESAPRFDAREAARVRMKLRGGMSLLCSATPSVESYYRGKQGVYTLVELSGRYGPARLPSVTILDMQSQEIPAEGLSQELCQEIHQNLQSGEQTILLMNRRGYSTQVKCTSCHTAVECPNCSITMKYHSANNRLMCHYCGYSAPVPESCPVCGSEFMKYTGLGTQRVEEVLRERWPQARVLRMDMDTTMRRDSHERLLGQFRAGEYDIMVGTQMVAKGLDFPNVTLVGVLTVDQMLYSEDFRSYERTFSLVTQVVGRCGRAGKPGRAFIQTYTPENPILLAAASQNYPDFYREEIQSRKFHLYPPFCRLYCVGITGEELEETEKAAKGVLELLKKRLREEFPELPARLLGLSQGAVFRVAGRYRYKILIKTVRSPRSRELFSGFLESAGRELPRGMGVFIDPHYDSGF